MATPKQERVYVYVDGFNLYYGILARKKFPGFKWLDLNNMIEKMYRGTNINFVKIKYFSAIVSGKYDPDKPVRQATYWRALRTLPNIEIIEGHFLFKKGRIHITQDVDVTGPIPEEKGTDVNIATHLVNDAHLKLFDAAILISNDSDLAYAVEIVASQLHFKIGVINPCKNMPFNAQIVKHATFKKPLRDQVIAASQFPATMTDAIGQFTKPKKW